MPVYEEMKRRLLSSYIIWTYDTPIDLQDCEHEKNIRQARSWAYLGDDSDNLIVYDLTDSRRRAIVHSCLMALHTVSTNDAILLVCSIIFRQVWNDRHLRDSSRPFVWRRQVRNTSYISCSRFDDYIAEH